jgi:hypothetical protein
MQGQRLHSQAQDNALLVWELLFQNVDVCRRHPATHSSQQNPKHVHSDSNLVPEAQGALCSDGTGALHVHF